MKRTPWAAALALLLAATGCYRIRYVTRLPPEPQPAEHLWHHTFAFGLVEGSAPIDVSRTCPGGVAVVESYESASNFIVSTSVEGLASAMLFAASGVPVPLDGWTPMTVEITCASR